MVRNDGDDNDGDDGDNNVNIVIVIMMVIMIKKISTNFKTMNFKKIKLYYITIYRHFSC